MTSSTDAQGMTASEQYLTKLCKAAFLELWAHPNVYTDEGRGSGKGVGKELCDLLVVFSNHIIVFSDKHCAYKETGGDLVDWKRWYRKAIEKSVRQLNGAASFIRRFPTRLFLDPECQQRFPIPIEDPETFHFHLVAVTRGSRKACERYFGGKSIGSFRHFGDRKGDETPFTIGPIFTDHGLVHVFDETSLDTIFSELDTVSDFLQYITARASLLSKNEPIIWADGEEQLLAIYLQNHNNGKHGFDTALAAEGNPGAIYISEGHWESLSKHPQYIAKKAADRNSYSWDWLITKFIRVGDPNLVSLPEFGVPPDAEPAVREMASETRFSRRILADGLGKFMATLEPDKARVRVMNSPSTPERAYAVLAEPYTSGKYASYEEYRQFRIQRLAAYSIVARVKIPTAKMIVGIAFDGPSKGKEGGSEDLFCHFVPEVTQDVLDEAARVQRELQLFRAENVRTAGYRYEEFPDLNSKVTRQQRRAEERAAKKAQKKK